MALRLSGGRRHRPGVLVLAGACAVFVAGAAAEPPAAPERAPRLRVTEYGVGTRIVNRELQGRGERFVEGGRVWFWTRVVGGRPGDRIHHVWLREGKEIQRIGLAVGGPHWRTYSHKTLYRGAAGRWTVEARDAEGRVLARASFVVVPRSDEPAEPPD